MNNSASPKTKTYKSELSLYLYAITLCLGWNVQGLGLTLFNSASSQVAYSLNWPSDDSTSWSTWASSLIVLGGIFYSALNGLFMHKASRRMQCIVADAMTIIGCVMGISSNIVVFMIGRAILGTSMGINYLVMPVTLREMSPPDLSGKLGCMNKIGYGMGITMTFALAFGLPTSPEPNNYWIFMFLTPAILSAIRLLLFLTVYNYDTPKYYILHHEEEKAKEVLAKIYTPEYAPIAFEGLKNEQRNEHDMSWETVFVKYKKQVWLGLLLVFMFEMTGLNAINFYSTNIMLGAEASNPSASTITQIRLVNLGMGLLRTATAVSASTLLDRFGRKPLYLVGNFIIIISMGLLSLSLFESIEVLSRCMVLFFALGISLSFALINPVYLAESLPFKGVSLMNFVDNTLAFIVVQEFPYLAGTSMGSGGVVGIFFIFAVVGIFGVFFSVKETKGMSMDQIYEVFKRRSTKVLEDDISVRETSAKLLGD